MTEINNNSKRIFGLDLMRAIAIIMVLCSHCLWIYPKSDSTVSQIFRLFGFLGVEIFFVLSGFLIGKILYKSFLKSQFSFLEIRYFLKRRWFRTLPNYFLILVINIVIAGIIGYKTENLWKYFLFVHNFWDQMPAFFPESWSLSIEEWAYFILPFFLFITGNILNKNKSILFLLLVIALIIVFQMTKIVYQINTENTTLTEWNLNLKPIVIYRLDSILYGVLASWIYCNNKLFWRKYKLIALLIGSIGLFFANYGIAKFSLSAENMIFFRNVLYLPLVSVSIAFFLPFLSDWKNTNYIVQKPVIFVSLISYSVYLLHYSVILQLMKHFIPTENFSQYQLHIYTAIYLLLTFIWSALLYFYYERPLMNLREIDRKIT